MNAMTPGNIGHRVTILPDLGHHPPLLRLRAMPPPDRTLTAIADHKHHHCLLRLARYERDIQADCGATNKADIRQRSPLS